VVFGNNKKHQPASPPRAAPPVPPIRSLAGDLDAERSRIEEEVMRLELQITDLNKRALELSWQAGWIRRTPQAEATLRSLAKLKGIEL
jgi:hypothetical protein